MLCWQQQQQRIAASMLQCAVAPSCCAVLCTLFCAHACAVYWAAGETAALLASSAPRTARTAAWVLRASAAYKACFVPQGFLGVYIYVYIYIYIYIYFKG